VSLPETLPLKVPTDIYAVKEMGLDAWQADFFWGVSDPEFFELTDALLEAFDHLYEGQDKEGRDLLLCDVGFIGFFCQHAHALVHAARCAAGGIGLIHGPLSSPIQSPDWATLARRFVWFSRRKDRWAFQIRRMAKRIRFNGDAPLPRRIQDLLKTQDVWSLGSFTRLKSEFVKSKRIICDHPYVQTLLTASRPSTGEAINERLDAEIQSFGEKVQELLAKKYQVQFAAKPFLDCWTRRLRSLLSISGCLNLTNRIPKTLLLSELGNPLHRLIALRLRQRGTGVIGFHHGNDMGNAWEKFSGYVEAGVCDEFVCPTAAAARFHEEEYRMSGISRFRPVKFRSVETRYYWDLHEECKKHPCPGKIRTVMVMGYPMNPVRYHYSTADFFLFQLDVELRLMKLLKEKGFKVIYKMHPERRKEAAGLFDGRCDEISIEPFEKVWDQADAFFFGCTTSTTFGFALCTNRPVFVLDVKGRNWNPEAYDLLTRRCVVIPTRFGNGNRLEFDEETILRNLSMDVGELDMEYLKRCMFPQAGGEPGSARMKAL
jgi:hypothetical protein